MSPILVVDDDEQTRRAIARILRAEGYAVSEAADGPEAVCACVIERMGLVVLDFLMPGLNGELVAQQMNDILDDDAPPVVLLTDNDRQRARAAAIGAAATLMKPFQVESLLFAIETYGRQRGIASERHEQTASIETVLGTARAPFAWSAGLTQRAAGMAGAG